MILCKIQARLGWCVGPLNSGVWAGDDGGKTIAGDEYEWWNFNITTNRFSLVNLTGSLDMAELGLIDGYDY